MFSLPGKQSSTVWNCVHDRRKSWFYHGTLYRDCPVTWTFYAPQSRTEYLAQCFDCLRRHVSAVHYRRIFNRSRRSPRIPAIGFSMHILVIDHFSPKADGVVISCVQFFTAGLISVVLMFTFEQPSWKGILSAWLPILYAGVMSSGVGYTLQIIGQKNLDPTVASLIMSLESVFAMLAGWVILGQKMSARELLGCALVFGAIILAQIPVEKLRKA